MAIVCLSAYLGDPWITPEVSVTDPAVLKITDYEIEMPTAISLPFITKVRPSPAFLNLIA